MHHEMRQGIIVLGLYPCFTSGKDSANRAKNQILFGFFQDVAYLRPNFEVKDNEKLNTYQIFPDYFIKTLLRGLTPAVSFQKILYFGAWPQH